jgi:hypothetical protein
MSLEFQRAIIRELDQIRLEKRDEDRDSEVSELKLQVSSLRSECRRNIRRDGILVLTPTTLVTAISMIINGRQAPPAPPAPAPAPIAAPAVQHGTP